jgi:hypothetical protein
MCRRNDQGHLMFRIAPLISSEMLRFVNLLAHGLPACGPRTGRRMDAQSAVATSRDDQWIGPVRSVIIASVMSHIAP